MTVRPGQLHLHYFHLHNSHRQHKVVGARSTMGRELQAADSPWRYTCALCNKNVFRTTRHSLTSSKRVRPFQANTARSRYTTAATSGEAEQMRPIGLTPGFAYVHMHGVWLVENISLVGLQGGLVVDTWERRLVLRSSLQRARTFRTLRSSKIRLVRMLYSHQR
jgi:hypothetical protein